MLVCCFEDIVVADAWLHLGNVQDVMPVLTQALHDLLVNTLVDQEVHYPVCFTG